jgi:hypothetical protein
MPAKLIPALVERDAVKPRPKRPGKLVLPALRPDCEKHLLKQLFAAVPVADHPLDKRQQGTGVAAEQDPKRITAVLCHLRHQLFVSFDDFPHRTAPWRSTLFYWRGAAEALKGKRG